MDKLISLLYGHEKKHYDTSEYGCLKQSVRGTWHFVQYQAAPAHGCVGEVQSEQGCESAPVAVRCQAYLENA